MEQKAKKYEELNRYEKAMTNATLEQRLEAMAKDLTQMALALKISVSVDATFHNWSDDPHATVRVVFIGDDHGNNDNVTTRDIRNEGDLFGIIDEALNKKADPQG